MSIPDRALGLANPWSFYRARQGSNLRATVLDERGAVTELRLPVLTPRSHDAGGRDGDVAGFDLRVQRMPS